MSEINNTIKEIYAEYTALEALLKNFDVTVIEDTRQLQFEIVGINNKETLEEFSHFKFFVAMCVGQDLSMNQLIQKLESPHLKFTLDDLEKLKFRLRYTKNTNVDYIQDLDFYFFLPEKAISFVKTHSFDAFEDKIFIGLYDIPSFSTPVFQFVDILNEINYTYERQIEQKIQSKIDKLLSNSDKKFNAYTCPYSFMVDTVGLDFSFKQEVIREFYTTFFKLISYKCENGSFDIRGKKNIIIYADENFSTSNYQKFIDIVDFLFKDEKFLEKFLIVKNVFTRYVHNKEDFTTINAKIIEIDKTINYYFEKYVQDDLEDFFKNRDTVYKEAINISKSINEQNDKINTYINASLVSFLILSISFIFKNVTKLNISNLIVANVCLSIFSVAFYCYISNSSKERYLTIKSQFMLFLNKMGIILPEEKEELTLNYLTKPKNDLLKSLSRVWNLFMFLNLILLIIVIITSCYSYSIK